MGPGSVSLPPSLAPCFPHDIRRGGEAICFALIPAPPIYRNKEKKPYNIDKMPIKSSCFEAKVMLRGKMTQILTNPTYY